MNRYVEGIAKNQGLGATLGNPFDLRDDAAYGRWRSWKLANRPASVADLEVPVDDPALPGAAVREAILHRCRRYNMAIYTWRRAETPDCATLAAFAAAFGLGDVDRHLCADDCGVARLSMAGDGRRRLYIPYSDRDLSWHTDGYYNEEHRQLRAVILHCAQDAETGGENALLDHELAYIALRDADPAFIEALMHPEAMTIPANREEGVEIRPARAGPVFSTDPEDGALHMRFSARKRNIVWRDDGATRAAVDFLNRYLADPASPVIHCRLAPGQGIVGNNVLHNRTAFRDDPGRKRLVYRMRFHDRIADTGSWL